MKTITPLCPLCDKPVHDAYVCSRCWTKLERDLGDITFLAEELQTTITRQSRLGGNVGSRSTETPVFFNVDASESAGVFKQTLVSWTMIIVEERGLPTPQNHLRGIGTFLLASSEWLRHHPAAQEAYDELRHAVGEARRAVDRRPDKLFAGPCDPTGDFHLASEGWSTDLLGPCLTDMYATPGKELVMCRRCKLEWNVQGRREYLVRSAQDLLVTAADLSKFLSAYGEPLTVDRVYKWVQRGLLVAHGVGLYRVGDAVDLLARMGASRKKAS